MMPYSMMEVAAMGLWIFLSCAIGFLCGRKWPKKNMEQKIYVTKKSPTCYHTEECSVVTGSYSTWKLGICTKCVKVKKQS